jgi:predicted kinase
MSHGATDDSGSASAEADSASPDYATMLGAAKTLLEKADAIASTGPQPPIASRWHSALAMARDALAPSAPEAAAVAAFGVRSLVDLTGPLDEQNGKARACAEALAATVVELRTALTAGTAAALTAMVAEMCADPGLTGVLPFLICLAALVRARLAYDTGGAGPHSAESYWRVAVDEATRRHGPGLVLCCGLSGSGKSFVAGGVAGDLGAAVISSDRLRKVMAGLQPTERTPDALRSAVYNGRMTERVYCALNERAAEEMASGRPVVLDATFLTRKRRRSALAVARTLRMPTALLWCEPGALAANERLRERASRGWTISDADARIRAFQRRSAQRPEPAEEGAVVIQVDTRVAPAALFTDLLLQVNGALAREVGA